MMICFTALKHPLFALYNALLAILRYDCSLSWSLFHFFVSSYGTCQKEKEKKARRN